MEDVYLEGDEQGQKRPRRKKNHTPGIEMRNTEVAEDLKQNRMLEILNRSDSICGEKTKLT